MDEGKEEVLQNLLNTRVVIILSSESGFGHSAEKSAKKDSLVVLGLSRD